MSEKDKVIWRHELREIFEVTNTTMWRWINAKKLPEPDVAMSSKKTGWRESTLRANGINITG